MRMKKEHEVIKPAKAGGKALPWESRVSVSVRSSNGYGRPLELNN